MKSFVHIQIFQNGINEEGMSHLLPSLGVNINLEILKLNDNLIKDKAPLLYEILPSLKNLRVLDISDSLLGNTHSLQLFKSISELQHLREIYSNYNEIEKKSVQRSIFELCLSMPNLETVEIKGNEIDLNLWKSFKRQLRTKIKMFTPYSDEEEVFSEEEEEELAEELEEKLKLNK